MEPLLVMALATRKSIERLQGTARRQTDVLISSEVRQSRAAMRECSMSSLSLASFGLAPWRTSQILFDRAGFKTGSGFRARDRV